MAIIYLDYAATTPVDPRVIGDMVAMLGPQGQFGNPASSTHAYGREAREAVETARQQVADLLQVQARDICFTSGATESDNLALKGIAACHPGGHIITSAIEHHAVLDPCHWLEQQGHPLTRLMPDANGQITPEALAAALRDDTCLVSIMHANNETGVVNDLAALGALCREHDVVFHADAAQSTGKLPLDLGHLPVDLLSISGHKLYGPKGIGALFVRRRAGMDMQAQMHGGGQERGLRAGTLASHQIVGLGRACALAAEDMQAEGLRIAALRDRLQTALLDLGGVRINGSGPRLPGHLNLGFEGLDGELLRQALTGIAVSAGSACTSASPDPSHVLQAMGCTAAEAEASLRFSLGRFTTPEEIETAIEQVSRVVQALRR